jgi:hypothetical protein
MCRHDWDSVSVIPPPLCRSLETVFVRPESEARLIFPLFP